MVTLDDIKYATFRKSTIGGYRTDDVDTFIDDIQDSFKELLERNGELENKVSKLKNKIETYQEDEDAFKKAFLNAQKVAEESVKDAKIQANSITEDAKVEANRIIKESGERVIIANEQFDALKLEISLFKKKIIDSYKEHLQLLDSLPVVNPQAHAEPKEKHVEKIKEPVKEEVLIKPAEETVETNDDEETFAELDLKIEQIKPEENQKSKPLSKKEQKRRLKFGENYKINEDEDDDDESPLDLFGKF